ncbi:hypothetical protein NL676_029551 [Syzygium grande]|nr:hypothetical protein NL676_029551 [Syzygium grande]
MHTLKPHRLTFSSTTIISFKLTPTDSPFIQFTSRMHVDCRQSPPSLICQIPYKPAIVVAPSVLSFVVASSGHELPEQNSQYTNCDPPKLVLAPSQQCSLPARLNLVLVLAGLLSLI